MARIGDRETDRAPARDKGAWHDLPSPFRVLFNPSAHLSWHWHLWRCSARRDGADGCLYVVRPPQLAASCFSIIGIGIGNSNCCAKPNRFATLASYSHLVADDSAISKTRPRCLPRARADLVQELEKLLCSIAASSLMGLEKSQDCAATLRQWIIDVVHRKVLEMPRLAAS
jgi:hypothetical protein